MIEQLFEVATEFRFDVGQAMLNTSALQGAVDNLSNSAQGALSSLNYLASGLVARLGLGSGGLLSLMSAAVREANNWQQSSLLFANNISSNFQLLTGTINTFNERLQTSDMLMRKVEHAAIKIGIPTDELSQMTMLLAGPLAQHKKLGTNYEGAINLGKNIALASAGIGINPMAATQSMIMALTDHMALRGELFSRLVNTQAFKHAGIITQSQMMNMRTNQKIDLLITAMKQLGGDAEFAAARLNQIGVQFTIIKDRVMEVLRPIGQALMKPLVMLMKTANQYLDAHGKELGEKIGALLGDLLKSPTHLFYALYQLKHLGSDMRKAMNLASLILGFHFLRDILAKLGIELSGGLLMRGIRFLLTGLMRIGAVIADFVYPVVSYLVMALLDVVPIFAALTFFFQIISRARAIAHVRDIKNFMELLPKFASVIVRLKAAFSKILAPILMAMDFWAHALAPLFEIGNYLKIVYYLMDGLAYILELVAKTVQFLMSVLNGFVAVLVDMFVKLSHFKNPFGTAMRDFKEGFHDFMAKGQASNGPATKSVVINNNAIEARFDMRQQLEPDRIAFAVTEHLKKLAINATQGRGHSLHTGFSGSQPVGGFQ